MAIALLSTLSSNGTPTPPIPRPTGSILYGFHINGDESDPDNAVTYLEDAVGLTPAYMDFSNDVFNYGSWENAFFMPKPCMLKYDGTVDYYLNPDDYTKKANGNASDVTDVNYGGNAMMEWGQGENKIWMKIVPSSDRYSGDVYISNMQLDSDFHDWSFHNRLGNSVDHFYTAIYNGYRAGSSYDKLRSLSGKSFDSRHYASTDVIDAVLNNPDAYTSGDNVYTNNEMWNIECYSDRLLITMLCVLISKSLNSRSKFGLGSSSVSTTGVCDTDGMFYGKNSAYPVKIFGMENFYNGMGRRINGLIYNNVEKAINIKMTYGQEDGSSVDGYNFTGFNYLSVNAGYSETTGYIKKMTFTENGLFPADASSYYQNYENYCDYYNKGDNSNIGIGMVGGASNNDSGLFYLVLNQYETYYNSAVCACISCKPVPST